MSCWQEEGGGAGGSPAAGAHRRVPRSPWRWWKRRCASAAGSRGSLQSCRVTPCRVRSHPSPAGQRAHDGDGGTTTPPANTPEGVPGALPSTCPLLLVTAAPLVPAEDAGVVGTEHAGVVDADLAQGRQPLVQLVDALRGDDSQGAVTPLWEGTCVSSPSPSPSHLALEVGRLLLPTRAHVDHLHDVGAPEALLLHLLGSEDVGQGDGAATLMGGTTDATQGVSATDPATTLAALPGTPLPPRRGSCRS